MLLLASLKSPLKQTWSLPKIFLNQGEGQVLFFKYFAFVLGLCEEGLDPKKS
jgi:hypothetical protein